MGICWGISATQSHVPGPVTKVSSCCGRPEKAEHSGVPVPPGRARKRSQARGHHWLFSPVPLGLWNLPRVGRASISSWLNRGAPKWGWWEKPRQRSPSPPSPKPKEAQVPPYLRKFLPGVPSPPAPRPHAVSPTLPAPSAGIPGCAACQKPNWLPFLGLELRRNFGGILRLRCISAKRGKERERREG